MQKFNNDFDLEVKSRSYIEGTLLNAFLKIQSRHGNPVWAIDELNWLVFDKHRDAFWSLSESDQWEVRCVIKSIELTYK